MTDKDILKKLMKDRRLDVDGLADQSGIPPWDLQSVLQGDSNLTRDEISALKDAFDLSITFFDFSSYQGFDHRFEVVEVCNGYQIEDRNHSERHHLSDGVDVCTIENPESGEYWTVPAGTPMLLIEWQRQFNEDPDQTLEAYWPEQFAKENDEPASRPQSGSRRPDRPADPESAGGSS